MPFTYRAIVGIPENMLFGICDRKIGDKIKFTADYQVIEKTKSYVVLKINSAFLNTSKRKL